MGVDDGYLGRFLVFEFEEVLLAGLVGEGINGGVAFRNGKKF